MRLPLGMLDKLKDLVGERNTDAVVSRAPGRVEILGNHTDYNDGLVLAATIDRFVWTLGVPADDVHVQSLDFQETLRFHPRGLEPSFADGWQDYVKGVFWALERRKHRTRGLEGVVQGDVPIGAGVSSSAALEVSLVNIVASLSELSLDPVQAAMVAFEAERLFCGVSCGIMDQFTSQLGIPDSFLSIDCSNLQTANIPIDKAIRLVVVDSMVSRAASDVLNQRKMECTKSLRSLQESGWKLESLSEIQPESLPEVEDILDDRHSRRVKHVVLENRRVMQGIQALRKGDLERFGAIMKASHASSRDFYEVSNPRLDFLTKIARNKDGVIGSRMTGAGFGGAVLAVVNENHVAQFRRSISEEYLAETGLEPDVLVANVPGGVVLERP
ncbi:MAG: galactokinase [Candidatus Thorarchaeota archaeon]|jgi:galactokinase